MRHAFVALTAVAALVAAVLLLGGPAPDTPPGSGPTTARPDLPPAPAEADPGEAAPTAARSGFLAGAVLAPGGEPAPGAKVVARAIGEEGWPGPYEGAPAATADDLGGFSFVDLEPGRYWLELRDERGWGFLPVVPVSAKGGRPVRIRLAPEASIAGHVVDEGGRPVAGATVTTDLSGFLRYLGVRTGRPDAREETSFAATTGPNGAFRLDRLPIGRYDLRVEAPGHAARTVVGIVAPVDEIALRLYAGHSVPVVVEWPATPREAPEWVRVESEPPDAVLEFRPKPTGPHRFEGELAGLPEGRLRILASADGLSTAAAEVEIVPGRRTPTVTFRLERGTPVEGRVVEDGNSSRRIAEARIDFVPDGTVLAPGPLGPPRSVVTDAEGEFQARLATGGWRMTVRAPGYADYEGRLPIGEHGPGRLKVRLRRTHSVEGFVRQEDGVPAAGAEVEISVRPGDDRSSREFRETVPVDAAGHYRLTGLWRNERFDVVATAPGGLRASRENLGFGEGDDTVRVDLVLAAPGRGAVRGRIVDETGAPVARALVLLPGATAAADADGRFLIEDFPSVRREGWILAAGHPPTPIRVFAPVDDALDLGRIVLPWTDPTIWGKVVGEDAPWPFARVRLVDPKSGEVLADALSREDGVFGLAWPLPRDATAEIVVSAPGRIPKSREGTFDVLSRAPAFRLAPLPPLEERFDFRKTEVTVLLRETANGQQTVHRLDRRAQEHGRLIVRRVPAGTYEVSVRMETGMTIEVGEVRLPDGGDLDLGRLDDRFR